MPWRPPGICSSSNSADYRGLHCCYNPYYTSRTRELKRSPVWRLRAARRPKKRQLPQRIAFSETQCLHGSSAKSEASPPFTSRALRPIVESARLFVQVHIVMQTCQRSEGLENCWPSGNKHHQAAQSIGVSGTTLLASSALLRMPARALQQESEIRYTCLTCLGSSTSSS